MTTKYIQDGNHINHTPGSAVTSGQVVLVGTKIGVAIADIAANDTGALRVVGVFSLTKLSTDNVTKGAALYWDNANSRLTTTASGNTYAGWATEAAGSGVATVNIKINN